MEKTQYLKKMKINEKVFLFLMGTPSFSMIKSKVLLKVLVLNLLVNYAQGLN